MTQQEWNSRKIRETQQIKDLGLTEKAKGGNYNQREKKNGNPVEIMKM